MRMGGSEVSCPAELQSVGRTCTHTHSPPPPLCAHMPGVSLSIAENSRHYPPCSISTGEGLGPPEPPQNQKQQQGILQRPQTVVHLRKKGHLFRSPPPSACTHPIPIHSPTFQGHSNHSLWWPRLK